MEQVVREIAERLGLEAARVWPQVIMVTWTTSLFWTIVDPVVVAGSVILPWKFWRRVLRYFNSPHEAFDDAGMVWVAVGVLVSAICAIAFFSALTGFPDQVAGVLYPEATTVLRLAKSVK